MQEAQCRASDWEKAVQLADKAAQLESGNLKSALAKNQSLISEKDSVIEFLNFEAEEKRRQYSDLAKALDTEQKFVICQQILYLIV